jgi:hypothetical protein
VGLEGVQDLRALGRAHRGVVHVAVVRGQHRVDAPLAVGVLRQRQAVEEPLEAPTCRDFEVIALPHRRQLPGDLAERPVVGVERQVPGQRRQDLVSLPRRRAHFPAVDRDHGDQRAVEIHQGIEEVEDHRLIRFHAAPSRAIAG